MPHSHIDSLNTNHARDKREEQLQSYSHHSLETAYKVACTLPMESDVRQVPAEAMIAAMLEKEFGPLD
jgi:hypothetical protein